MVGVALSLCLMEILGQQKIGWAVNAKAILAAFFAALMSAGSVLAGQQSSDEGVLMLNPGYALPNEPFADSKTHAAIIGIRLHKQVELGFQQTINYAGIADAEQIWDRTEIWRGRSSSFANFDWAERDSKFVPFIGAFAGLDYDAEDASIFLGPHAGFSQYLDETTFLRLRYRYEWRVEELEQHDFADQADDGDHILSLGLGVNF